MKIYKCAKCYKIKSKTGLHCKTCSLLLQKGKNHPNYKGGVYIRKNFCIFCKKEISQGLHIKYCKSCSVKQIWKNKINKSLNLKHGHYSKYNYKPNKCRVCSKLITPKIKSKRCHSCENKRRYKHRILNNKGKLNGQYIHGEYKRKYPKEFNKELKVKIFKRDNYTCHKCLLYPSNKLTVHHIDYNKSNNKETNLITLCRSCNVKVNTNRIFWASYFTKLLSIKT